MFSPSAVREVARHPRARAPGTLGLFSDLSPSRGRCSPTTRRDRGRKKRTLLFLSNIPHQTVVLVYLSGRKYFLLLRLVKLCASAERATGIQRQTWTVERWDAHL